MTGEWQFALMGVALIIVGVVYVVRPEWFSRGWFGESRIALPSPARNRVIGFVLIAAGLVTDVAFLWLMWAAR